MRAVEAGRWRCVQLEGTTTTYTRGGGGRGGGGGEKQVLLHIPTSDDQLAIGQNLGLDAQSGTAGGESGLGR